MARGIGWMRPLQHNLISFMLLLLLLLPLFFPHAGAAVPLPPFATARIFTVLSGHTMPVNLGVTLHDAFFTGSTIDPLPEATVQFALNVAYTTGGVRVGTRPSVSEAATMRHGKVSDDPLRVTRELAGCRAGERSCTRYSSVQGPVPPYLSTKTTVKYNEPVLPFRHEGAPVADINTSHGFSFYNGLLSFGSFIPHCVWTGCVFMRPSNTWNPSGVRCGVLSFANWSTMQHFPTASSTLFRYITPTFPYACTNKVEVDGTGETATGGAAVQVGFVSSAPANGMGLLTVCGENSSTCTHVNHAVRGINIWRTRSTNATSAPQPQANAMCVECKDTPLHTPFRFLLHETHVELEPAGRVVLKGYTNLDFSWWPYQRFSPLSSMNGAMLHSMDCSTSSVAANDCVSFADDKDRARYKSHRDCFDADARACFVSPLQRSAMIHDIPFLLRSAPKRMFGHAIQQRFIEELQLPPWVKLMKQLLREAEESVVSDQKWTEAATDIATWLASLMNEEVASRMAVSGVNAPGLICTIICVIITTWKRGSLLNWLCCFSQRPPQEDSPTTRVVSAQLSTYFDRINSPLQGGELLRMGMGPSRRHRAPEARTKVAEAAATTTTTAAAAAALGTSAKSAATVNRSSQAALTAVVAG
ncbi:hypothetical protein DQ04_13851010 [Trypanosoma grayi]|uniref:hypothetical protein n=1 Tax=Trypanosoma grayi TaxID=71804 RepID=UPI0004F4B718|nr:hypothetical protein DQ04_13851010 [Trypanosoma grayi]KEG06453.1 hypothetical protein DQ04_13851010 [Trypanosoma grayi]